MSGPTCWQTTIYLSITDTVYRVLSKRVVCLILKFSAGVKDFTRSFTGNNSEHVVAFKLNFTTVS
jgi:hypothetical protein